MVGAGGVKKVFKSYTVTTITLIIILMLPKCFRDGLTRNNINVRYIIIYFNFKIVDLLNDSFNIL